MSDLPFRIDRARALSLTEQLTDGLREGIFTGFWPAGERLPTRAELMAACGVSKSVVQSAIARLTSEGLIRSHRRLGCLVTRTASLRMRGHVLVVSTGGNGTYHIPVFTAAFSTELNLMGTACTSVNLLRLPDGRLDLAALKYELDRRPDAVIVIGLWSECRRLARIFDRAGVPFLFLYAKPMDAPYLRGLRNSLGAVCRDESQALVDFVADCRRTKVLSLAWVSATENEPLDPRGALEEAGVSVETLVVPNGGQLRTLEDLQRAAYDLIVCRLARGPLPEVIFSTDDYVTMGLLSALLERGVRIPADVRFVTLFNRGNGPVLARSLAKIEWNVSDDGRTTAHVVAGWLKTGVFRPPSDFQPRYVRGETFPGEDSK